MIRQALKNPIAVLMVSIGLVVFAAVVVPRMAVDSFPELTPPVLVIGAQVPGLGARDIEKAITWRIEKYVGSVPGVDHVESLSRNGFATIYVWLKWGTDLNAAQTLVQQQVSFAMAAVPKSLGAVPPFVLQYDPSNMPVIQVVVRGTTLTGAQLYDFAQNVVEPELESIAGVASASPKGGQMRQINVIVDPIKARAYGLSSDDVANAVRQSNALLPSGLILSDKTNANLYTNAVAAKVSDIGEGVVKLIGAKAVLIRDVARIEDGGTPPTMAVSVDGGDAVYMDVMRVPGGNTLSIVDQVKERISHLKNMPQGIQVKPVFDSSLFVRSTYHGLQKEILQALLLIGLVILIFLQDIRSVLIAAIAIPISFAVILMVLFVTGQTLNAFTLGGLTLAMGPLVDISVVVLESIHRHREGGLSRFQAALAGTTKVSLATFAALLTTLAVLIPVALFEGLAKKLFSPLALTVATGLIAGWVVSMTVTPVACRYFLQEEHAHQKSGLWGRLARGVDRLAAGYASLLAALLPFRLWLLTGAALLVLVSGAIASRLPLVFFPDIDEAMERIYVRFAPGTSLKDASDTLKAMGAMLQDSLPKGAVDLVLTNNGVPPNARAAMNSTNVGPHTGFIRLSLTHPEEREADQTAIADQARRLLSERFPGVDLLQSPGGLVARVFGNGYWSPIAIEIRGTDLDTLSRQSKAVAQVARTVGGLRDVYEMSEVDYPEVRITLDRQAAGMARVSARDAAQAALEATLGNINAPSIWVDGSNGQSYYVVTQYDAAAVSDPSGVAAIPARVSGNGKEVPLGAYATVTRSVGPSSVMRSYLQRRAVVLANSEGRDIGSAATELEQKLKSDPRTRNIDFHLVGQVELMRTTFSGLGTAIGLAVMLVFMIMASQFKSLRLPLVMLFTIPMTLVGIVTALMAAGQGFSITALMGVLMVIGIAVSNGILLVDEANRRLQQGHELIEAAVGAARVRFTPILMTSLATIIGLLPTAMGLDISAAANRPLALAVVGGLASSTLLSLFVVPSLFTLIARPPSAEALSGETRSEEVPLPCG